MIFRLAPLLFGLATIPIKSADLKCGRELGLLDRETSLSFSSELESAAKRLQTHPTRENHQGLAEAAKKYLKEAHGIESDVIDGGEQGHLVIVRPASDTQRGAPFLARRARTLKKYKLALGFGTEAQLQGSAYYDQRAGRVLLPWGGIRGHRTPGGSHEFSHVIDDVIKNIARLRIVPAHETNGLAWSVAGLEGRYGIQDGGRGSREGNAYRVQADGHLLKAKSLLPSLQPLVKSGRPAPFLFNVMAIDNELAQADEALIRAKLFLQEDSTVFDGARNRPLRIHPLEAKDGEPPLYDRAVVLLPRTAETFSLAAGNKILFRSEDLNRKAHSDADASLEETAVRKFLNNARELNQKAQTLRERSLKQIEELEKTTKEVFRKFVQEASKEDLAEISKMVLEEMEEGKAGAPIYLKNLMQDRLFEVTLKTLKQQGIPASHDSFNHRIVIPPSEGSLHWLPQMAADLGSDKTQVGFSGWGPFGGRPSVWGHGSTVYLDLPWDVIGETSMPIPVRAALSSAKVHQTLLQDYYAAFAGNRKARPLADLGGEQLPMRVGFETDEYGSTKRSVSTAKIAALASEQELYLKEAQHWREVFLSSKDETAKRKLKSALQAASDSGGEAAKNILDAIAVFDQAIKAMDRPSPSLENRPSDTQELLGAMMGAPEAILAAGVHSHGGTSRIFRLPDNTSVFFDQAQIEARQSERRPAEWVETPDWAGWRNPLEADWSYDYVAIKPVFSYVLERLHRDRARVAENEKLIFEMKRTLGSSQSK